jgi:hypothetical protein
MPAQPGVSCWRYWPSLPVPPESVYSWLGAEYQYLELIVELGKSLPLLFKGVVRERLL